jgi:hypothetical protein
VLVGYWVIQLDAGIPEKFALILAGSVTLAMLAYHFTASGPSTLMTLASGKGG